MRTFSFFIVSVLFFVSSLRAQEMSQPTNLRGKVQTVRRLTDSIIDAYTRVRTDTSFVSRPDQPLTIQLREDVAGELFHLHSEFAQSVKDYYLSSAMKSTFGVSLNYRGLSVSASLNLKKLLRKTADSQYLLNYYNNRYGADLSYNNLREYSGRTALVSRHDKLRLENVRSRSLSANVYYVFSSRRFSYPAAFTHTWLQKRSAGSFITAMSYYDSRLFDLEEIAMNNASDMLLSSLRMQHATLGFGYAYNWVPSRRWLIHVSTQPSMVVWKNYVQTYVSSDGNQFTEKGNYRVGDSQALFRVAVNYNVENYFYGITAVMQQSSIGRTTNLHTRGTKWRARLYCGVRL